MTDPSADVCLGLVPAYPSNPTPLQQVAMTETSQTDLVAKSRSDHCLSGLAGGVGWGVGGGAGLTTQPPPVNHPPVHQSHASHHPPSITHSQTAFFRAHYRGNQDSPRSLPSLLPDFPTALGKAGWRQPHKGCYQQPLGHVPRLRGKPQKADLAFYAVVSCEVCLTHPPRAISGHWSRWG